MKRNKIYRGYHHEDLTLKFLKENTTKYIAKITGAEFCDEINVELINLKPKVLRIDYGIKKKDKIILYEFLSTKSNIANILRRIFLYVARIGYDYQLKVKINLVVTPEIDKNQVVLEYSPGQFFRPEVISFKDYERRRVYICLKKGVYHPISPIILTTFLPSSVRRYRRPLWASSLMQTIRLCSFKSVSTLLTCFIPTPDSSLIFVGILTSFFKVSSTFRL